MFVTEKQRVSSGMLPANRFTDLLWMVPRVRIRAGKVMETRQFSVALKTLITLMNRAIISLLHYF